MPEGPLFVGTDVAKAHVTLSVSQRGKTNRRVRNDRLQYKGAAIQPITPKAHCYMDRRFAPDSVIGYHYTTVRGEDEGLGATTSPPPEPSRSEGKGWVRRPHALEVCRSKEVKDESFTSHTRLRTIRLVGLYGAPSHDQW
jgi:hypothetical protein